MALRGRLHWHLRCSFEQRFGFREQVEVQAWGSERRRSIRPLACKSSTGSTAKPHHLRNPRSPTFSASVHTTDDLKHRWKNATIVSLTSVLIAMHFFIITATLVEMYYDRQASILRDKVGSCRLKLGLIPELQRLSSRRGSSGVLESWAAGGIQNKGSFKTLACLANSYPNQENPTTWQL